MATSMGFNATTDYTAPSRASRNAYGTNWTGNGIWSTPIGTGLSSTSRTGSRPPPLTRSTLVNDGAVQQDELSAPSQITGSSSLLTSSEGEGWSSRWGASSRPVNHQSGTSPVRNRTNQHTRESSPFFVPQPSAIGTGPSSKPGSATLLDPTTSAFAPRDSPGSNLFSPRSDIDTRQQPTANFGFTNHGASYSGYGSSAASRNGSLPPSRHGMEPPQSFTDFGFNNPASAEAFMHRPNQHSRSSNFSSNGLHSGKMSNHAWQSSIGDLSSNMNRLDLGRQVQDRPGSSYYENRASTPGSMNGGYPNNYQRSGSLSHEPGTNLLGQSFAGYGQQRFGYGQESNYSPNGGNSRSEMDSPLYSSNLSQMQDWNGDIPSHSSRSNLSGYAAPLNHQQLDRALHQVANAQSYQPSPALSQRSLYSNGYNITGASTPNYGRMSQSSPYYPQQNYSMGYGTAVQSARHPPRGPAAEQAEKKLSPLLQDYHLHRNSKKYELKDFYGHIVEFAGDQHGSRFLQAKLESANSDEKAMIFNEILPNAIPLMTDLFGNYVMQKFFEHGNQQQKKQLADKMKGQVYFLTMQMYACRVVQKALDVILVDQQASLIKELEGKVIKCVKDQHGNHVIQKAIERIPSEHITFITGAYTGQVHHLAGHNYGCRIIQRMLESSHEPAKTQILEELHGCVANLVVDQFGNYVTQNIVKHGRPSDRDKVIAIITSNLVNYALQKFASNVVETAFVYGSFEQRQKMIGVVTSIDTSGESTSHRLMRDQYGNYIIQRFIKHLQDVASVEEYDSFVDMLRPALDKLKSVSYGKQVGQIEKLLATARTPHTAQPSPLSNEILPPLDIPPAPTPALTNEDAQSPRSSSHPSTSHSTTGDVDTETSVNRPQKIIRSPVEVSEDHSHRRLTPTAA